MLKEAFENWITPNFLNFQFKQPYPHGQMFKFQNFRTLILT